MRRGISVGLVSEALSVLNAAKKYNCFSLFQINQLAVGYGINKPAAIAFLSWAAPWAKFPVWFR